MIAAVRDSPSSQECCFAAVKALTDAALAVIIDRLSQSVAFFDGSVTMTKFVFHIRARTGQRADNIVMQANGAAEAERRLRQMHHHCEILECRERAPAARIDALDVEAVIGMISREPLRPAVLAPSIPPAITDNAARLRYEGRGETRRAAARDSPRGSRSPRCGCGRSRPHAARSPSAGPRPHSCGAGCRSGST